MRRMLVRLGAAACLLLSVVGEARAGRILAAMGSEGGSGADVNLIARQVRVAPVRAHVGDPVRIDAVVENRGEGRGTVAMRVYANGKPVAGRLLTYDVMDGPRALYRESFVWDTAGSPPGEYRIRAEAFEWNDSSPFDNDLVVGPPVILAPAGAAFPGGLPGGGEAVATDPRWRPESPSPVAGPRNSRGPSDIERETASGGRQ